MAFALAVVVFGLVFVAGSFAYVAVHGATGNVSGSRGLRLRSLSFLSLGERVFGLKGWASWRTLWW